METIGFSFIGTVVPMLANPSGCVAAQIAGHASTAAAAWSCTVPCATENPQRASLCVEKERLRPAAEATFGRVVRTTKIFALEVGNYTIRSCLGFTLGV
jgi:hypothetical protein